MISRPFVHPYLGRVRSLLVVVTVLFSACSDGFDRHPPVYPVKGKVLHQGKPISGGVVVYELEGEGPTASGSGPGSGPLRATGRIDADGSFRLSTFAGAEGAPEGHYKVGVSSMPPRGESNLFDGAGSVKKGNPDVLRGRYADPKTSGLQAQVVKDQPNEPTFDLK